ncbi:HIT domain-containing protein [Agarivorans sp. B2Z047]|uniref:HIT family protein n=1 Tax=Agarivorans sp. B2Z047 TaxID=2652721 RepID=UPI00128DCBAB|nr:HIT domain-containing protein [Agarivorans sp. B2Z047]MPW30018.1 HIT domain-containing protein [Agarivorans sp. B2Z047]UQN43587.1 HIT domain-containing protein [Agarivorans sp. B2Z047]
MTTIVEKIVSREIKAVIVFESEDVIAFADHDPINIGHVLICPKNPYESFIDLPGSVNAEIQYVAKDLYSRILTKFNPDGISFIQNNGSCNELGHYHLHIFPRFNNDKFKWETSGIGIQTVDDLKVTFSDF